MKYDADYSSAVILATEPTGVPEYRSRKYSGTGVKNYRTIKYRFKRKKI
jgi:hypothetical protein